MKVDKAEKFALHYMQGFADYINECETPDEYFDLVISIFVFQRLVENHFLDISQNSQQDLDDLKEAANEISKQVISLIKFTNNVYKTNLN